MKKFYKLLQAVVDTGEAKDIMLKYQTNMTVLTFEEHKITKFIPEFHKFEFTVSLDGIEEENNYIITSVKIKLSKKGHHKFATKYGDIEKIVKKNY